MKRALSILLNALNSRLFPAVLILFCAASFYFGQKYSDMNLFAASGGVTTVFGLLSLIRFTTIEKYLNQDAIAARSTGLTGSPVTAEEAKRIQALNTEAAKLRIASELKSEVMGIALTISGTLVWAYGAYIPLFQKSVA